MVDILLISVLIVAFLITFFTTIFWIKAATKAGLVGKDMNKIAGKKIAEAGGICVLGGFIFSLLLYIGVQTFIFNSSEHLIEIFAVLCTVLIIGFLGFTDNILGWKVGIRQLWKPLLTVPAVIPLVVINAGESIMNIPFFGNVNFGILYPLLIIPIAIIGTSNGFNMLAGMNGLEAGLGVVILSFMGFVAWQTGFGWVALIAAIMVMCLLAFLLYNWTPARVFPGDTLTYSVGALIGIIAILGNMEKIGVILFIPFFIELLLKARYKFKTENFGVPQKDGKLELPQKKVYSVTHISLKSLKKFNLNTERNAVLLILCGELILCWFCWFFFF